MSTNKINQNPDCDMATLKIKFRPSTVDGGQGSIFYQVIHNRVVRQQKTGYRLFMQEWNKDSNAIIITNSSKFIRSTIHFLLKQNKNL